MTHQRHVLSPLVQLILDIIGELHTDGDPLHHHYPYILYTASKLSSELQNQTQPICTILHHLVAFIIEKKGKRIDCKAPGMCPAITTNGDGDLFVCRVSFLAKGRKCNQSNTNWPFNRNKSLADDQTESRAGECLASLPFLPLFARPPSCTSAVKRDGN